MSYQPPEQPPSGYDPNQARGEGGYDPNSTSPLGSTPGGYQPPNQGGYQPPDQGGAYQPPNQGGYGAPPPDQGGYGAPPPGSYQPPNQGGYGAPPPANYSGQPGYYGGPPQPVGTSWAAIVGLITGILSVVTCCVWCISIPLGIAGAVFYFVAQGQLRAGMGGKGLAIAGLICGIVGILLGVLTLVIGSSFQSLPFYSGLIATMTAIAAP